MNLTDEYGRPVWPLQRSEIAANTENGRVIVRLWYAMHAGEHNEGQCPALALSTLQAAQLASALQQQVLALKGNVVPFPRGPKS